MRNLLVLNLLFMILFVANIAPIIFFMLSLPMILQTLGFESSMIGFFQLIGLPIVLKFLFSPFIDRFGFIKNHYKNWIFIFGFIYALLLTIIGFFDLKTQFFELFILIGAASFISTLFDIPINSLAIKVFRSNETKMAGAYKITAYFIAGLLGGGIFLLFYNHFGWQNTMFAMVILVIFSIFSSLFIKESKESKETKIAQLHVKEILGFFRQKNIKIWLFILAFYFSFISSIWTYMKPYLIIKELAANEVAFLVGIYGGVIGVVAGVVASKINYLLSTRQILLMFSVLNLTSILTLILGEIFGFNYFFILFSVSLASSCVSFSSSIVFALMMDYSRSRLKASDYGLQSSIMSFFRIIFALIAGILVSNFGYLSMFITYFLGICLVIFCIWKFYTVKTS